MYALAIVTIRVYAHSLTGLATCWSYNRSLAVMWKVTVFIALFTVMELILPAVSQLPCNSQLRNIRPELFQHCKCSYSQWSSWKITEKVVSTNCTSGKAFKQIRTRHGLQDSCAQQNETKHICKNDYLAMCTYVAICSKLHMV